MDVSCNVDLDWSGSEAVRTIVTPAGEAPLPVPGRTDRPRPEFLLIAAIACCYGVRLSDTLRAASLPRTGVSVRADGVIDSVAGNPRFTHVTVNPAIRGADIPRRVDYERAALMARDESLIGRAIRGNVAYIVGNVSLLTLTQ